VLFGWSRAILMQLAHPLVAAGVAEHSTFRAGRLTAAARLHQTVRAMLALTFGGEPRRQAAIDNILAIHRRVHGHLRESTGRFPAGTRYSAEDPELVHWVHTTLLDSIPLVYERLVSPLRDDERDAYCRESASVAIALGGEPAAVPRDQEAVRAAIARAIDTRAIAVGHDARALADAVLTPPLHLLTGPAASLNRLITIGLLPEPFRREYGFVWTLRDERRFERACRLVQLARDGMPRRLALWREARRAMR
jgi:uncharacterized protein (DUF2236 family)